MSINNMHESDEHGPDEHGPDEHGPDEHGPDEHGPDEHGPDKHGPDGNRSDGHESDRHRRDAHRADSTGADEHTDSATAASHDGLPPDVDRDIALAWHRFRHRLAAELAELRAGCRLVFAARYTAAASDVLAVRSTGRAFALALAADVAARAPKERRDFPAADEPAAAAAVVRLLRQGAGIVHPSFLDASVVDATGTRSPRPDLAPGGVAALSPGMTAIRITNPAMLHRMLQPILTDLNDGPVERDEDGDYVLDSLPVPAWVRVRDQLPVVELHVALHDVASYGSGIAEANALNARGPMLTFMVVENQLVGRADVWCFAFVPDQVRAMLRTAVGRVVELAAGRTDLPARDSGDCEIDCESDSATGCEVGCDDDCQHECNGEDVEQPTDEVNAGDTAAHGATDAAGDQDADDIERVLLLDPDVTDSFTDLDQARTRAELTAVLDASGVGDGQRGIDPELVAQLCAYDPSTILELIRGCELAVLECRASGGSGAQRAREIASWEATADVLLRALRVTVERA